MRVGVPKETAEGERRVALVPEVVRKLTGKEHEVVVEAGAGAGRDDPRRRCSRRRARRSPTTALWGADVVVKVAPPSAEEIRRLPRDGVLIGFLAPLTQPDTVRALRPGGRDRVRAGGDPAHLARPVDGRAVARRATSAGYRAALLGAQLLGRFYPMLMTAAGTIPPGQGARARRRRRRPAGDRHGAPPRRAPSPATTCAPRSRSRSSRWARSSSSSRRARRAEGEGGYARELTDEEQAAQQQELTDAITEFDVVITTALVPGRPAPKLVTADAVQRMKPGAVVVDLAGEAGGNCELTEPGETVVKHDVTIAAPLNLPSTMAEHASQLYARNIQSLLELMTGEDGALNLDFDDEIIAGACVTRDGEIVHEGAKQAAGAAA